VIICPRTPAIKKYRKHQEQKTCRDAKKINETNLLNRSGRVKKNGTARM
jgi:hypothetical protein